MAGFVKITLGTFTGTGNGTTFACEQYGITTDGATLMCTGSGTATYAFESRPVKGTGTYCTMNDVVGQHLGGTGTDGISSTRAFKIAGHCADFRLRCDTFSSGSRVFYLIAPKHSDPKIE